VVTAYPSVEATRLALRAQGIRMPLAAEFVPKSDGPDAIQLAIESLPFVGRFSILHISDLHLGYERERVVYDQARSQRALRRDLDVLRSRREIGPIKAVVVSGDIAYRGQPESYERAFLFLKGLCTELKIGLDHVVLVPGNHDVNRQNAYSEWERLPTGEREANGLYSKYEQFLAFTSRFYGEPLFTEDRAYRVFEFGSVMMVALDSCHREGNPFYRCRVCPKEHYYGWIDEQQLFRAMSELEKRRTGPATACIAVCHHHALPRNGGPPGCNGDHLVNYHDPVKYALAEAGISVLLHGHSHKAALWQASLPGAKPYVFGSGTLLLAQDPRTRAENQYVVINLETGQQATQVLMRRYEPSLRDRLGGWAPDNSAQVGGIITIPSIAASF
jgi:3',5'-cyclic AMP phosphodiesterase CpdA